jgi:hypothetical protein
LYCTGDDGGGAQSTLNVTCPLDALEALLELLELVELQPAAASAITVALSVTALGYLMKQLLPVSLQSGSEHGIFQDF